MFNNGIEHYDGWYVIPGTLGSGSQCDLAVSLSECVPLQVSLSMPIKPVRPPSASDLRERPFSSSPRWLEFTNFNKVWVDSALFDWADYICRSWTPSSPSSSYLSANMDSLKLGSFDVMYFQKTIHVVPRPRGDGAVESSSVSEEYERKVRRLKSRLEAASDPMSGWVWEERVATHTRLISVQKHTLGHTMCN